MNLSTIELHYSLFKIKNNPFYKFEEVDDETPKPSAQNIRVPRSKEPYSRATTGKERRRRLIQSNSFFQQVFYDFLNNFLVATLLEIFFQKNFFYKIAVVFHAKSK